MASTSMVVMWIGMLAVRALVDPATTRAVRFGRHADHRDRDRPAHAPRRAPRAVACLRARAGARVPPPGRGPARRTWPLAPGVHRPADPRRGAGPAPADGPARRLADALQ